MKINFLPPVSGYLFLPSYRSSSIRYWKFVFEPRSEADVAIETNPHAKRNLLNTEAIVTSYLYEKYPNENEGFLTRIRTKLVSGKALSKIATELKLQKHNPKRKVPSERSR